MNDVSEKSPYYRLDGASGEAILSWWKSLDDNRGVRARLRRAEVPSDVMLSQEFFNFLKRMPESWGKEYHLPASAMVAALLSHVKECSSGYAFAAQLGSGDPAVMSELRFKQMIKSRTPDELYIRLLRAINMLKGKVNILSLVEGILLWHKEYYFDEDQNPMKRLSVKWAQGYYLPKESKLTKQPETSME